MTMTIDLTGLVRPHLVEMTKRDDNPNAAEFRLQPLERGFILPSIKLAVALDRVGVTADRRVSLRRARRAQGSSPEPSGSCTSRRSRP